MTHKNNSNHDFYINSKGEEVLRVSNVIKMIAKEQLMVWANMLGFKQISYKKELERTANIGSLCHDVIQHYFDKHSIAMVDYEAYNVFGSDRTEASNALRSFLSWYKDFTEKYKYDVVETEKTIIGENLGGTIDCIIKGIHNSDKLVFVDYKTSSNFYFTQFLQLSAYVMIYEELYGTGLIEGVMVIRLCKDGSKGKARFLPRANIEPFITCFQCLYDVAVATKYLESEFKNMSIKI